MTTLVQILAHSFMIIFPSHSAL